MDISHKIVREIPLKNLWTSQNELDARRKENLAMSQLKDILRNGPVQFVISEYAYLPGRWEL